MAKHLILFIAADPAGTERMAIDDECAAIERELSMADGRDDFEFRSQWAVGIDDLARTIDRLRPTVVHFSCHGGGADGLVLEEDGVPQPVPAHALALLLRSAARIPRVVVLNACGSAAHARALAAVVDCVVGMEGKLGDEAARSFAAAFYRALANRRSVGDAVAQGVAILAAKRLGDLAVPRCVTRPAVDAARLRLDDRAPLPWLQVAALTATVVLLVAFVTISLVL